MQLFNTSLLSKMLVIVGALLVAMLIFWAGAAVGYRQADFANRWNDHYGEVFSGKDTPFGIHPPRDSAFMANGATGQVIAVNLPLIAVKDVNQAEKVVLIASTTAIRKMHGVASSTEIRVGDLLIAIGVPDAKGRIMASFVRIMPAPTNPINQ